MSLIYFLRCPLDHTIRYIGKTDDPYDRLAKHLKEVRSGESKHRRARWLKKIVDSGLKPELKILFKVPCWMGWPDAEKFFIASAVCFELPLTNATSGGEGFSVTDPEVRERLSMNAKSRMRDPRLKSLFLEGGYAYAKLSEVKARRSEVMTRLMKDIEFKKRSRASNVAASDDPEIKAKWLASLKEAFAKPDVKARKSLALKAALSRPEVIAKKSASAKLQMARRKTARDMTAQ